MERGRDTVRKSKDSPVRVLVVSGRWGAVRPGLKLLESQDRLVLLGPVSDTASRDSIESTLSRDVPSVIVATPECRFARSMKKLAEQAGKTDLPPVLVCLTPPSLESGDMFPDADDLIVLPCTAAELDLRLRRLASKHLPPAPSPWLRAGATALNPATFEVQQDGRPIRLAWMEFQLLKFLMENPDRIFTREQLLANVWGTGDLGGTRTVDVHIRRLRNKLEVSGDELFRTVKNVGYGLAPARRPASRPA